MFKLIVGISILIIGLGVEGKKNAAGTTLDPQNGWAFPGWQACYRHVGCFRNLYPYSNTLYYLPNSPKSINTVFQLYTRSNPMQPESLSYKSEASVSRSSYNPDLPLKVIVHGFTGSINTGWMHQMKDALLTAEDVNVILVGWEDGAKAPYYTQAAANIRVVARQINLLLDLINSNHSPSDFDIHCIGHSLGAQLCGMAGQESTLGYDRISALDPANQFFEGTDPRARVDPGDAEFVDVMHTNMGVVAGLSFGIVAPSGHIDFYVNGGEDQPGCGQLDLSGCSHGRATELYIESIDDSCAFTSYLCESWARFRDGQCNSCGANSCSEMGYYANTYASRGNHYLSTESTGPYCSA